MDFGVIVVYAMFIIPAIFGVISAMNGTSLSEMKARCERYGEMISASATRCPHCLSRSPFVNGGYGYYNKSKRKADSNTPMSRFIRTYVLSGPILLYASWKLLYWASARLWWVDGIKKHRSFG